MIILTFNQRSKEGKLRAVKIHIARDQPVKIEYDGEEFIVPTERVQQIAREVTQLVERFDDTLLKTQYQPAKRSKPR